MESSVNIECPSDSITPTSEKSHQSLVSSAPFNCRLCGFDGANSRYGLYRHYETAHPGVAFPSSRSGTPCPVPGCSIVKFHSTQLVRHLNSQHGANITEERLYFRTQQDFECWRESEEKRVGVKFTKRCGGSEKNCILLVCQRYGTAQYSQRREYLANQRQQMMCTAPSKFFPRSPQGNAYCPARINVRRKLTSSERFDTHELLVVNYVARHSHATLDCSQTALNVNKLPLESLDGPHFEEGNDDARCAADDFPSKQKEENDAIDNLKVKHDCSASMSRKEDVADEQLKLLLPVTRLCESFQEQLNSLSVELHNGVPRSQVRAVIHLWRQQAALLEQLHRQEVRCEVRVKPMITISSGANEHTENTAKVDEVESAVAELESQLS